jgi:hypothetical protein
MGQGLGLIGIQQHDIASRRLLTAQLQTQPDRGDLVSVLPAFQRVPRTTPAEAPFFRRRTLRRDREIPVPVWRSTSAHHRGSVQLVRFRTGSRRSAPATANACSPFAVEGPGASVARNAPTRPRRTIAASGERNRRSHQPTLAMTVAASTSSCRAPGSSPRTGSGPAPTTFSSPEQHSRGWWPFGHHDE